MTRLEFGNEEHIKLAQKGAIPGDAVDQTTTITREDGCAEGCIHCDSYHYECENCGFWFEEEEVAEMTDHEGKKRCSKCKFLIE